MQYRQYFLVRESDKAVVLREECTYRRTFYVGRQEGEAGGNAQVRVLPYVIAWWTACTKSASLC
jgi:hypothetical protein